MLHLDQIQVICGEVSWQLNETGNTEENRQWTNNYGGKVPWLPDLEDGYVKTMVHEQLQHTTVQNLYAANQKMWDVDVVSDLFDERDKKLILQKVYCYACVDRVLWKRIWSLQLPGKMLNFIWRACSNVLPTAVALQSKRVNVTSWCS